ncbi:unnamed protein product [Paramecium primaurelia]|uniref:Uncharacterized protein n=1 Tax=Paramecium primaurelia TaxID=5886 RepID=A0A8S1ME77_PARPR|nr:unnamed protein product [Paramecium primaurelia]
MQYHVSKQDILGTLQDVFIKNNHQQENQKHSKILQKPCSVIKSNLESSTSKNKLERYLEKYQQRKQLQDENNISIAQSIQNTNNIKVQQKLNDSQTAYSSKMSFPRENTENDDKEQQLTGVGLSQYMSQLQQSKLHCTFMNQYCQTEPQKKQMIIQGLNEFVQDHNESSNSVIDEIKLLNSKHTQQNTICQQIQLSILLQKEQSIKQDFSCQFNTEIKQQVDNQQINQICQINQENNILTQIDFGCQYDESNNQVSLILDDEHPKNIRNRSRCQTSANQKNKNNQINSDDQITFLEQELQLRDEMLETKTRIITDMQQQLSDFYKIFNKESDIEVGQQDLNSSKDSDHWKVDELNRQLENDVNIQDQLTQLMLKYSDEILELKKILDDTTEQNRKLKEEQEQLIIQITQLKQQLVDVEESKAKEIDIINQDYQDKLSKQIMIIDELQSQICSIQTSPTDIPLASIQTTMNNITEQHMDEVGCESQTTKTINNQKAKNVLKHINKMTIMTAGWMSNKQDYVTLGVLGRIDQIKSQTKLDSFKKLN